MRIENGVKLARISRALSQAQLAARAGVTRQVISAIESGDYTPTTGIALKLAHALGRQVEDLFWLGDEVQHIEARLALLDDTHISGPLRVRLGRCGEDTVAIPLTGPTMSEPADGLIEHPQRNGSNIVRLLESESLRSLEQTLFAYGCDPALAILGGHLHRRYPGTRLAWMPCGSTAALQALLRGDAHMAGTHLHDGDDSDTLPTIRRVLGNLPVLVVTFATWEEGLIVAPGNPKSVRTIHDFSRPDVTIINRELGSGARNLLDRELASKGIESSQIRGYERVTRSHQAVAEAVAAGTADAGIGIRAAANALGLGFVMLHHQRYDLVITQAYAESSMIQALLDQLSRPALRREIEALGGYDISAMGQIICEA